MKSTIVDSLFEQELFEMANIVPEDSGLPFIVWISPANKDRHKPRLKVQLDGEMVPVGFDGIQLAGKRKLSSSQLDKLSQFIELNKPLLLQYWTGEIVSTKVVLSGIKPVS